MLINRRICKSKKTGALEVQADFGKNEVVFHPLPKIAQGKFSAGQKVDGCFGVKHTANRKDSRGIPIYIQYFIPEGF